MRQTIENVISIGGELTVVQAKLAKHNGGTFQAWCRLEFGWSKASAYNFINVFNQFGSRPNIGQLDAGLSALYMLAAPGVPDEARDEAIARAEQGERITVPAAATIIQSFRPPVPPSPVAPMSDEEWAQLADRGEGGIEYVDPDDSPEGAQPAPYRPPQPPPMTTITVPAHGIQVGMWLTDPGQGGKWKIVGLTGTRANLQNAISSNIAEFPIEWVATWQRTDAPAPQPPRPFVTSSQPSGALTIPPQPPQPPRALTSGMTSSESEEWYTGGGALCAENDYGTGARRSGSRTYPPQFGGTEPFRCRRAPGTSRKLPETPEYTALREQVKALRAQGMSYPAIANQLNISQGRAWSLDQG